MKWTSDIIMNAITCTVYCAPFSKLKYLLVPNITLTGVDRDNGKAITMELDLLAVTKSGYCTEIEIKTSVADVKADLKKRHTHNHRLVKKVYMALPLSVYDKALQYIPERFGIITCNLSRIGVDGAPYINCNIAREATINSLAIKATELDIFDFQRKAAMRFFTLLNKITNKELNTIMGAIDDKKTILA